MATTNYPHPFLATLDTQLTTALPELDNLQKKTGIAKSYIALAVALIVIGCVASGFGAATVVGIAGVGKAAQTKQIQQRKENKREMGSAIK